MVLDFWIKTLEILFSRSWQLISLVVMTAFPLSPLSHLLKLSLFVVLKLSWIVTRGGLTFVFYRISDLLEGNYISQLPSSKDANNLVNFHGKNQ